LQIFYAGLARAPWLLTKRQENGGLEKMSEERGGLRHGISRFFAFRALAVRAK
jgi:hypothetical protein